MHHHSATGPPVHAETEKPRIPAGLRSQMLCSKSIGDYPVCSHFCRVTVPPMPGGQDSCGYPGEAWLRYAADDAAVTDPFLTAHVSGQMRLDLRPWLVGQPEQVGSPATEFSSRIPRRESSRYGFGRKIIGFCPCYPEPVKCGTRQCPSSYPRPSRG
jgi:hypothetical protein